MKQILRAAGQPEIVISQIEPVVSSCSICRAWKRPQPRAQSSRPVPEKFNDRVQADIVWLEGQPILHVIDEATRYSPAVFLPNQNDVVMQDIIILLSRWGVQRVLLPEGQHGGIVERRNEILGRSAYHKIRDQTVVEGTGVLADILLSEAVFGKTPPALMIDTEETSHEAVIGGEHSLDHIVRVREVAVCSVIESLTEDRIRRAEKSQTHQAARELELNPGNLVDFYRQPVGKVNSGWRGAAKVVDVSSLDQDGIAHVRWQGQVMSVQAHDVRPHLKVSVWLFRQSSGYTAMFEHLDNCNKGSFLLSETITKLGLKPTHQHPEIYEAMQEFAYQKLGI
eukprot:6475465-Amphidinium_carterae.1